MKKVMSPEHKAKIQAALQKSRKERGESFKLNISKNVFVTADEHQYVLNYKSSKTYFTNLASLAKHLVTLEVRTSETSDLNIIIAKIDQACKNIDQKFTSLNPANV